MTCGIYQLHSPSGKTYIGSSRNIEWRLYCHWNEMKKGTHKNRKLQNAYGKYGKFSDKILLACHDENLILYEQACIDLYKPEYNCSPFAARIDFTEEVRRKISESKIGIPRDSETRRKIGLRFKGGKLTEEHKRKISEGNKGKHHREMSQAQKDKIRFY